MGREAVSRRIRSSRRREFDGGHPGQDLGGSSNVLWDGFQKITLDEREYRPVISPVKLLGDWDQVTDKAHNVRFSLGAAVAILYIEDTPQNVVQH